MEYEATRFTEFLHARYQAGAFSEGNFPKQGKLNGKIFAEACGVKVANQLAEFDGPDSVDFARFPDRGVLKATNMYSCKGVYVLQRRGAEFYEMIQQKTMSPDEIIADMKRAYVSLGRSWSKVILEEMLVGENGPDQIPYDYKFFMFGRVVGMIQQVDRNALPVQLVGFKEEFQMLDQGCLQYLMGIVPGRPVVPVNAKALIETAQRISLKLGVAFCGIDLYTTGEDVYFGEITPVTGLPYQGKRVRLSKTFDLELGALWRAGCLERGLPIPKISSPPPAIERECLEAAQCGSL